MSSSTLIVPIGISGSGKSTLFNKIKNMIPDVHKVCMDDIRKELTGSISDQSMNKKVFQIRTDRIRSLLSQNKIVYVDSTNLIEASDWEKLFNFENLFIIVLTDSFDVDLCYSRVSNDINTGIDRANVPLESIEKQHDRFVRVVSHIRKNGNYKVVSYSNNVFEPYKSFII